MAELKTKENNASVKAFINSIKDKQKKGDALKLLKVFQETTKEKPKMWGSSIIGFGKYHYKSERSSQEGDWPPVAFSPRKQNISLYVLSNFKGKEQLLKKLGKHKAAVGCLYINKLEDIDIGVLKKIIKESYSHMMKKSK